jgi:hypothetical protein
VLCAISLDLAAVAAELPRPALARLGAAGVAGDARVVLEPARAPTTLELEGPFDAAGTFRWQLTQSEDAAQFPD